MHIACERVLVPKLYICFEPYLHQGMCVRACVCLFACVKGSVYWNFTFVSSHTYIKQSCVCVWERNEFTTQRIYVFQKCILFSCWNEFKITQYWKPLSILHHFKMTYTCTMTQHMYNEDKIMIVHVHLKKRYQNKKNTWEKPSVEVAEWNERLSTYKLFHRISTQTTSLTDTTHKRQHWSAQKPSHVHIKTFMTKKKNPREIVSADPLKPNTEWIHNLCALHNNNNFRINDCFL